MRWLNPSAVLNLRKPSMALVKESATLDFDVPGELRFIRNSSIFGKMSTAVRQANEKPEPDGLWFDFSSGEWIRTTDLRVMSPTSYLCSTPHRLSTSRILLHSPISVKLNLAHGYSHFIFYHLSKPSYR